MISRYTVWLNDVSLEEIDPSIYVADISYTAASPEFSTLRLAATDGRYSGKGDYIKEAKISVSFEVHEYRTERRQEIVQNVAIWASKGGWLKTSDRMSQRIYVKPTRLPAVVSAMRWTDNLSVEFTAFDFPFWVDEYPTEITLARNGSGSLFVPGMRSTPAELAVTATAAVSQVEVHAGNSTLILQGLGLVSGDVLTVSYTDEHHILEIKNGNTSLLDKRTAESDDDLIVSPGVNTVSFSANGNSNCVISVRGVYV